MDQEQKDFTNLMKDEVLVKFDEIQYKVDHMEEKIRRLAENASTVGSSLGKTIVAPPVRFEATSLAAEEPSSPTKLKAQRTSKSAINQD